MVNQIKILYFLLFKMSHHTYREVRHKQKKNNCCSTSSSSEEHDTSCKCVPVYGEFIRTFTFSDNLQLPIVQPGGSIPFPIPTVLPRNVVYIENVNQVGLLVPRGVYELSVDVNPGTSSVPTIINVLVNGVIPTTSTGYKYGQIVVNQIVHYTFLINAPLEQNNLISLVNGGTSLFSLGNLPNSTIDNTSVLTHLIIEKIN